MMKKLLLVSSLFLVSTVTFAASHSCDTHEACAIGAICECNVGTSSAYDRNFYMDFTSLQQHANYECKFSSDYSDLLVNELHIPQGAKFTCSHDCKKFPIDLKVDTNSMVDPSANLELKYTVPASDTPENIDVVCDKK